MGFSSNLISIVLRNIGSQLKRESHKSLHFKDSFRKPFMETIKFQLQTLRRHRWNYNIISLCLIFPFSPVFSITRLMLSFIFNSTLLVFLDDLFLLWFYLPNLPCYKFRVKIKLFGIWLLAWKRRNSNKMWSRLNFRIQGDSLPYHWMTEAAIVMWLVQQNILTNLYVLAVYGPWIVLLLRDLNHDALWNQNVQLKLNLV